MNALKKVPFLVTGLYRSGTTLLERLLDTHNSVTVLSQPFPFLFYNSKRLYMGGQNGGQNYPINTMFGNESYFFQDFSNFLNEHKFDPRMISHWHKEMMGFSGHKSAFLQIDLEMLRPGRLCDIYFEILQLYESALGVDRPYLGSKEIVCEEFLHRFLLDGVHVLHIIRDPRDVVCSLHGGDSTDFIGKKRPILFTLRLWRKSVAFFILLKNFWNYRLVKFEDLIDNHGTVIDNCFDFLGVTGGWKGGKDLLDSQGQTWRGNSSFGTRSGVESRAKGRYMEELDENTILFIERICLAEMKYLDYALSDSDEKIRDFDLSKFRENEHDLRNDMKEYHCSASNLRLERIRMELIKEESIDEFAASEYFINGLVFRELRSKYN